MEVQNREIYSDRKSISGCLGLERRGGGMGGVTAKGYGVSFQNNKNIPKVTTVMGAHIFEYAKNLKWVNYMVSKLYLNKVVFKM